MNNMQLKEMAKRLEEFHRNEVSKSLDKIVKYSRYERLFEEEHDNEEEKEKLTEAINEKV